MDPMVRSGKLGATDLLDDEALAEAVRVALRRDSRTAGLHIEVEVWDRIVHLRGFVATLSAQEAAEAVAARVSGVGLVANDLHASRQ
jgi:osmotically-inducible protein OsmY